MLSLLFAAAVAATVTPPAPPVQCPLPNETPMIVTQLFFGRDIAGRGLLTEEEWDTFVSKFVSTSFPGGFTVSDGEGRWLDPKTHRTIRERAKVVTIAAAPSADLATRIANVTGAYKTQFHQQSVGELSATDCGNF